MPKVPDLNILGSTGLKNAGGRITEEFNRALSGPRGRRVYHEMATQEPITATIVHAITTFVEQTPHLLRNPSESAAGADLRDFTQECLEDMSTPFNEMKGAIAREMVAQGYLLTETVYKVRQGDHAQASRRSAYNDSRIGWRKWGVRPATTIQEWAFDEDGGIAGAYQLTQKGRVFLPIERCALWRTETAYGNPEGRSWLRGSFTSYHYASNLREVEAIGAERDLTGLLKITAPSAIMSATPGSLAAAIRSDLETMGQQIKNDERGFLLLPPEKENGRETGYSATLMGSPGSPKVDLDKVIRRHESRMALPLLAEFMFLGVDGGQGLGGELGEVKLEIFEKTITALLGKISTVLNSILIPRLMRVNAFTDRDLWPVFAFGDVSRPRLAELAAFLGSMIPAGGVMPDRTLENELRQRAGLPEAEDAEDL